MHEPPAGVDPAQLLAFVQRTWDPAVQSVQHLPVGFGAHHWRADVAGAPRWFVTADDLGQRHSTASLRAAYGGASALARCGLEFVVAPVEPYAVPWAGRAVSVTPWLDGAAVQVLDQDGTADLLQRLHGVDPSTLGVELPRWRPLVGPDLAVEVAARLQRPWSDGPYGPRARTAMAAAMDDLGRWSARYAELGRAALDRDWVPTHGEPGVHNQLITASGIRLVDWESLKLAPAERDLRTLDRGDASMLELFDLEWRLDAINQYAAWFSGPHGDTADDRVAFEGFLQELTR